MEYSLPSEMKGGGFSGTSAVCSSVMGSTDTGLVAETLPAEYFWDEREMQEAQWG